MRIAPLLKSAVLFASLATVPAFCQSAQSSVSPAAMPADASNQSIDYVALKDDVTRQNKILMDQVAASRALLKRNQDLLKEAQKMNAANVKLADEQKKLQAESADLEKQRETLKSTQKPVEVAAASTDSSK